MTNHPNRSSDLAKWADVRNTSIEIARSIRAMARNRIGDGLDLDTAMQDIWEVPSDDDQRAVVAVVAVAFAGSDKDELFWGEAKFRRPE